MVDNILDSLVSCAIVKYNPSNNVMLTLRFWRLENVQNVLNFSNFSKEFQDSAWEGRQVPRLTSYALP